MNVFDIGTIIFYVKVVPCYRHSSFSVGGSEQQCVAFKPADVIQPSLHSVQCMCPHTQTLAKADRWLSEEKKFYHQFSIVKYSYLSTDTFRKYVQRHVT